MGLRVKAQQPLAVGGHNGVGQVSAVDSLDREGSARILLEGETHLAAAVVPAFDTGTPGQHEPAIGRDPLDRPMAHDPANRRRRGARSRLQVPDHGPPRRYLHEVPRPLRIAPGRVRVTGRGGHEFGLIRGEGELRRMRLVQFLDQAAAGDVMNANRLLQAQCQERAVSREANGQDTRVGIGVHGDPRVGFRRRSGDVEPAGTEPSFGCARGESLVDGNPWRANCLGRACAARP